MQASSYSIGTGPRSHSSIGTYVICMVIGHEVILIGTSRRIYHVFRMVHEKNAISW